MQRTNLINFSHLPGRCLQHNSHPVMRHDRYLIANAKVKFDTRTSFFFCLIVIIASHGSCFMSGFSRTVEIGNQSKIRISRGGEVAVSS